jgi:hypothetical protein
MFDDCNGFFKCNWFCVPPYSRRHGLSRNKTTISSPKSGPMPPCDVAITTPAAARTFRKGPDDRLAAEIGASRRGRSTMATGTGNWFNYAGASGHHRADGGGEDPFARHGGDRHGGPRHSARAGSSAAARPGDPSCGSLAGAAARPKDLLQAERGERRRHWPASKPYIRSIIALPKPEQDTCVEPCISRAKS